MQNKQLRQLLIPSWVVNFGGIALGLVVTIGTIVLSSYQTSQLRQEIFENKANTVSSAHSNAYQNITANVAHNSFLGTLPLLLTWAAIGLVVYFFATSIYRAFSQAAGLRDQLNYVNSSRSALLRQAVINLLVRAAAVVAWFLFIKLTLSVLIPYSLAASNLASRSLSLENGAYALLSVIILYVCVYGHAVLLRLIALRSRLFG